MKQDILACQLGIHTNLAWIKTLNPAHQLALGANKQWGILIDVSGVYYALMQYICV
jgi:hypothetical protein